MQENGSFLSKVCERCDLGIIDNVKHIITQCPFYEETRREMYREITQLQCEEDDEAMSNSQDIYNLILGQQPEYMWLDNRLRLYTITGRYVTIM